jgi:hypothetical protein
MTQQQSQEGSHELRESMRSTSQLITQSLLTAQQRNLQFTQHTVEEAVEVLKSHAEAMSSLLEQLEQQETAQKLEQGTVEWVRRALSSYEHLDDLPRGQTNRHPFLPGQN